MSTFWKNVNRVAQDQLFTRGYLAPATALAMAAKRQASEDADHHGTTMQKRERKSPWPRLAALR